MSLAMNNAFWLAVRDCLVEFHGIQEKRATLQVAGFRWRLEQAPEGIETDMVYHAEPFDIACDIAQEPLDRMDFAAEYEQLLHRHFGDVTAPAVVRVRSHGYLPSV